jgi:tRNA(Ile)-lysidine synthase
LSLVRLKNLLRYRLRQLGWRAPGAARLEEFARQLQSAGPDRHPELVLLDGSLRVAAGCLQSFGRGPG